MPARGTALVALLPSAFGAIDPIDLTPLVLPNFEVRGFVRIRLPPIFQNRFPFSRRQIDHPAKTLLTPQNRATFLTATGAISDQTQTGLPLASGKALNEIVPEFGFNFPVATPLQNEAQAMLAGAYLENVPAELRGDLLALLLAQMPEDANLPELNRALVQQAIPVTIEKRKPAR